MKRALRKKKVHRPGVKRAMLAAVAGVLGVAASVAAAGRDVAGSADHPLLGRFEGSWIGGYDLAEFDEATVATGPVTRKGENVTRLEGRVTRIAYHAPAEISPLELYRNFRQKVVDSGFEVGFECTRKEECGAGLVRALPLLSLPAMWHGADHRYLYARKAQPEEGDVRVALFCEPLGGSGKSACQVTVIEAKAMEYRMIDAAAMADSIAERGSVALYGLYFDTDQATMKPESKPTLVEIATLLKKTKDLDVVIVGHTDNQGSLEYNLDLSRRRAESVRRALAEEHGIDPKRLAAWGAGYLAPVASNRTEEGRAKNRRVELVER